MKANHNVPFEQVHLIVSKFTSNDDEKHGSNKQLNDDKIINRTLNKMIIKHYFRYLIQLACLMK